MASKGPKTGAATPGAKPRAKTAPVKTAIEIEATTPVAEPAPEPAAAPAAKPVRARKPVVAKADPAPLAAPVAPADQGGDASAPLPMIDSTTVADLAASPLPVAAEPAPEAPAAAVASKTESISTPAAKKELFAMTSVETMTEKSQAMIAELNERAKTAMEKSAKMVEEMNDFAKGNVEALVESGRITAKGLETLGQDAAEFSRKSFESATAALKSLSSVKSPAEFLKLHSDFTRQLFDSYVAETSKTTEAVLKLAGDAAQPISNRVAVATEKMKTAA